MTDTGRVILELKNLTTQFYSDEGTTYAVNGISYVLHESETIGVVGESGSGKSAHALSIMGLISPPTGRIVAGEVHYKGQDLLRMSPRELRKIRGSEISMIFQDPMSSLNPVFTIGNQMVEALRYHIDISRRDALDLCNKLLTLVGIGKAEQWLPAYPHQLSGGMRQRVLLAIAVATNPTLLIADEPTTAVDVTIQAQMIALVRDLREKLKMSMIWISHDLGVIAGLADRILVMYAGQIVEAATSQRIFAAPSHPYTVGLLRSLPRMDQSGGGLLQPIQGNPPDLSSQPLGCPFVSRCEFRIERCTQERPKLELIDDDHEIACWVDIRAANTRRDNQ